ncbi:MAG: pilus assembly protein PilP [Vibrio sp.]
MKNNRIGLLLIALFYLTGCKANQEDLTSYIAQVERDARKEVTKLKPILEFEVTAYQQHKGREPFVLPKEALVQNQPLANADCWQPVPRAKTGPLERYPLHQLRLKGVMSSGGSISALVQTPAGNVIKVKAGQYVGINNGKVTRVDDNYLLINETLPDGLGCWNQRNVKLALK